MKLVLGLEDLDVEGAVGGKVLHSPGTQDGLVVLRQGGRGHADGQQQAGGRALPRCPPLRSRCVWGQPGALTAAVRSTSFRLLRIKQASPLSILQSTRFEQHRDRQGKGWAWWRPHLTLTALGLLRTGPH